MRMLGGSKVSFFVSGVNQGNEGERLFQDFLVLPQGCGSISSVVSRASGCNLMPVECLQKIKPTVIAFVLLEVDVILGDGCGI